MTRNLAISMMVCFLYGLVPGRIQFEANLLAEMLMAFLLVLSTALLAGRCALYPTRSSWRRVWSL